MDGLTYVSSAPKIWLGSNNECKWPKNKAKERQAIMKEVLPEPGWYTLTKIKILGEYCTYKEAVYYEKKKENAYSSSSDVEKGKGKRKKKINKRYLERSDSATPPPCISQNLESESSDSLVSSSSMPSDKNGGENVEKTSMQWFQHGKTTYIFETERFWIENRNNK